MASPKFYYFKMNEENGGTKEQDKGLISFFDGLMIISLFIDISIILEWNI